MKKLLVKYLLQGFTQNEISLRFKKDGIQPNSLSIIEKAVKSLKVEHKAKTLVHLGAILSDKSRTNK